MVNCIIISKSFMVREVYELLIKNNIQNGSCEKLMSINEVINEDIDLVVVDCSTHENNELLDIFKFKNEHSHIKIVLVFNNEDIDINLFLDSNKYNIEGFIIDHYSYDELASIIKTIINGYKYYDAKIVDKLVDITNHNEIDSELTKREKEIIHYINEGFDNLNISNKLSISENTVKKHIGHILKKLNLKNKKEIILYTNKKNIQSKEINYSA